MTVDQTVDRPGAPQAPDELPPPEPRADDEARRADDAPPARRWPAAVAAGGVYLVLGVLLWWHVWSGHPTATATCGCGDPSLFEWFLAWPAYALTHGHDPFYSSALYHPGGVNLLSNTSVLAVGVPLTPVTLLFGPVATLNVASTLAPAVSALGAFVVARRWVRFAPAAFVGGLLYGFSPFVLDNLAIAHLMMSVLVVPPFILAALDELLVRQRRPAVRTGVVLGLLVAVEFFVSTEMVVILAVSAVIGLALLVGWAAFRYRGELARRAPYVGRGLAAAAVVVVVLLAYPAWYALHGRAALTGPIWNNIPTLGGFIVHQFVDPTVRASPVQQFGGYYGPLVQAAGYVSIGLLAVLAVGLVVWRRDVRLWFFAVLAVATGAISLGVRRQYWVPWKALQHLPLFDNVIEQRFVAVTFLCLAMMLAIVVDRARYSTLPALLGVRGAGARRAVGWAAALAVSVLALVQLVVTVAPTLPFTTEPVTVPAWFALDGTHLAPSSVVLTDPTPFSGIQSSMGWQAADDLRWSMAGGGGPQGVAWRAGSARRGFLVLAGLGLGFHPLPTGTPAEIAAVRHALAVWEVTTVVVPRLPGSLPPIQRGNDPQYAAGFLTEVLGSLPIYRDRAWVWNRIDLTRPPRVAPTGDLGSCTAKVETRPFRALGVPRCVTTAAARTLTGRTGTGRAP